MATATLTSQLTDLNLDPGAPTKLGTGNAQASETAIQLQGANCAAIGHAGSVGPTNPTAISQFRGMYSAVTSTARVGKHLHAWVRDLYPIRNVNVGGVSFYIGDGANESLYYVTGLDKGYLGDWFHVILNLDDADRPAVSLGANLTGNLTRVGYCGNISVSKGEDFLQNCYLDAIRIGNDGDGVTFTGGTSGDEITFKNCADADTAYYGMLRDRGGSFFVEGPVTWGAAGATTYLKESLVTINFANLTVNNGAGGNTVVPSVAADYYRVTFADGTTGATVIDFTDVTWKGVSRSLPFQFDASLLGAGDSFSSLRSIYVYASSVKFNGNTTSDTDSFIECGTIVPGGVTLTDPVFSNCDAVTLTAANDAISGGSTTLHNTATGAAFITTDSLDKISGHSFDNTGGTGHAVDLGTISASVSMAWDNDVTGYPSQAAGEPITPGTSGNETILVNVASGQTLTINVTPGKTIPSVKNDGPGVVNIPAGSPVTTKITAKEFGTNALLQGAMVYLKAKSGGPLAAGTTIIYTTTDVNGEVSDTRTLSANQPVDGWVRLMTSPGARYKQFPLDFVINASTGADVTALLTKDE